MRTARLASMTRGWFVGNFSPSVLQTGAVEVAVKTYRAGDREEWHHHKIATEITVIVAGAVEMAGTRYEAGDIVVVEPGEETDFHALTDATSVVVKLPGATADKYLREVAC
ncbi:MAG: cupin domain-containing protein [Candidatus Sericytochromatia bacterium]|nr:cupin domain-containing protein [Candidatus Tanganyikabacteria bacterium]